MARAGASESLEKAAPKPRAAGQAKAVNKATEKKPVPEAKTGKLKPWAARAVEEIPVPAAKPKTAATKAAKAAKAPPARTGTAKAPAKAGAAKAPPAKVGTAQAATKAPGRKTASDPKATARKATSSKATAPKVTAKADSAQVDDERSSSFPAKTLDRLRRLLEEDRETYWRQAHDLAAEAEALASEREPGDTQFDEESGEGDTDGDGAVGQVEGRPVGQLDEVDHLTPQHTGAAHQAVDEVADGAPEHEGERIGHHPVGGAARRPYEDDGHDGGEDGEHGREPGQDGKGTAGVAGQAELQQAIHQVDGPAVESGDGPQLGELVGHDDGTGHEERPEHRSPHGLAVLAGGRLGGRQRRRSSRDLQSMHRAAKGSASSRATEIRLPQRSQTP